MHHYYPSAVVIMMDIHDILHRYIYIRMGFMFFFFFCSFLQTNMWIMGLVIMIYFLGNQINSKNRKFSLEKYKKQKLIV